MSKSRIGRLVSRIVPDPVHYLVHGNTIRVPRYWRLQKNVFTKTIDPEFEEVVEELDAIDDVCHEMLDIHKAFCTVANDLVTSSQRVVNSFHLLTNSGVTSGAVEDQNGTLQAARSYQVALEDVNLSLKESLLALPGELDVKIRLLMGLLDQIHKQINKRDRLLARYEFLHDKYDAMTIAGATRTFNPKQKVEYSALEKALDEAKYEYSRFNSMICRELPYYFMLVRKFMEPVLEFLFFIHLTMAYQTHLSFASLEEDMGISSDLESTSFIANHVEQFALPDATELDNLRIVRFHKDYLELLVKGNAEILPEIEAYDAIYCKALYDYNSEVPEDLSFSRGDVIKIITKSGNWWEGEVNGKRGMFPINLVESHVIGSNESEAIEYDPNNDGFNEVETEDQEITAQEEIEQNEMFGKALENRGPESSVLAMELA